MVSPGSFALVLLLMWMHATNVKRDEAEREWREQSKAIMQQDLRDGRLLYDGAQPGEAGYSVSPLHIATTSGSESQKRLHEDHVWTHSCMP